MKNKEFKAMWMLQIFAEGEGTGTDGNGTGAEGEGTGNEIGFNDFLKTGDNQAEFDRRVQKAIDTALTNAQKKWKAVTDDKLTEAEKLALMTKEEKAEYKAQKLEEELNALKRENAMSDMAKTARKMLSDEGISVPDEIISNLVSEDAEKTKASVEAFAKVFKDAVQTAVKEALKGNPPKAGSPNTLTKEQIMKIKNPEERRRLIAENLELFE